MRSIVELGAIAAATTARVELRRLTMGPRRPSWSRRAELYQALVRALTDRSRRRGVHWLRAMQEAGPMPLPGALAAVRFEPVTADGVPCVWALPPETSADAPRQAIVYFHGGGYVIGSPATHREIVARLATGVGAPVLAVAYRLAPEHRFPAGHDDCLTAVRWLRGRGVSAGTTALAGDSAGGALAVATLLGLRDAGEALPAAAALLCPWVDPLADGGSMRTNERFDFGGRDMLLEWLRAYASDDLASDPRLTPLRADLTGLPPLLVQVGEAEMFFDQGRAFAERARAAGVAVTLETYPDMFHDWQMHVTMVPEGAAAVAAIVRFLRSRLA